MEDEEGATYRLVFPLHTEGSFPFSLESKQKVQGIRGSTFSCAAFGSGLLVKVWFVFIVLT